MIKITTVVGTRPEIIRMSEIIKDFDRNFEHRLIHTGQNSDEGLKDVFFEDLNLRQPDVFFGGLQGTLGEFLAHLFIKMESELLANRPDAFVLLGDTNSAMSAIIAKRLGIPIYHLEAGNRSFDANVPEEINRRIVDHIADFNMPYTELARANLISEGIHPRKIALTGTPLLEVLTAHKESIAKSKILEKLKLERGKYFLVSAHRQENVDFPERLEALLNTLLLIIEKYDLPILMSTHPRTRKQLAKLDLKNFDKLIFHDPFGFLDYQSLQLNARAVLSDSGTVSEESAILGFPALTIRNSMERPEALESGSIIMSGIEKDQVLDSLDALEIGGLSKHIPNAYQIEDVSKRVTNFIISTVHQHKFWNGLY